MRHYMEDPDNEDRLLKIPPGVVAAIREQALRDAVEAVKALEDGDQFSWPQVLMAVAAIEALISDKIPPPLPPSVGIPEKWRS